MGLDIGVGWLAREAREADADEFAEVRRPYELLNEVLVGAGLPAHQEPLDITDDQGFEAQMWGYTGLHTVRRLAAYHAIEHRLPPPGEHGEVANDPVVDRLYQAHDLYFSRPPRRGWFARFTAPKRDKPKFQHLLCHSDCEGFYVPQPFDDVLLDDAQPQRVSLGGMVASSVRLLEECQELAHLIDLPADIDPEADELWDAADAPDDSGPLWRAYGVEAFCLARLIRGCELSLRHKAVLAFG